MLKCPRCESDRKPKDTHCPVCGADYAYEEKLLFERKKRKSIQPGPDAETPKQRPARQGAAAQPKKPGIHIPYTECPKCGFDREPDHLKCPMCGADYVLMVRLEQEKQARNRQAEGGPKGVERSASAFTEHREIGILMGKCPKCGNARLSSFTECPQCGFHFQKESVNVIDNRDIEEVGGSASGSVLFNMANTELEPREDDGDKAEDQDEDEQTVRPADRAKDFIRICKDIGNAFVEDSISILSVIRSKVVHAWERVVESFLKVNWKRLIAVAIAALIFGAAAYFLPNYFTSVRERESRIRFKELNRAMANTRQNMSRRIDETYERLCEEYHANKIDIEKQLKTHVDKHEFDLFDQLIGPYDIPPMQPELSEIKAYYEEIKLYETARQYPPDEVQKNYDAYVWLNFLNPKNKEYQKQKDRYALQIAGLMYDQAREEYLGNKDNRTRLQTALSLLGSAIELSPGDAKFKALRRDIQAELLKFYEGNEHVVMAVRDDGIDRGRHGGQRKIYIWMKNVGTRPFFPGLDYFILIGADGKHYKYNDSDRSLAANIDPGKEISGYLYFYTSTRPGSLVFDHHAAGRISRVFPE